MTESERYEPTLPQLSARLDEAASSRGWGPLHTPQNLLVSMVSEVGEVAAIFRWDSAGPGHSVAQDVQTKGDLGQEIADVLINLVRLSSVLGLELATEVDAKIEELESRFPNIEDPRPSLPNE